MSIRARLITSYLVLSTLGMTAVAAYNLVSFRDYYLANAKRDLSGRTLAIAESVADAMELGDVERVKLVARRYGAQDNIVLRVFDAEGRIIGSSESVDDARTSFDWKTVPGVLEALAGAPIQGVAKGVASNDDRVFDAHPVIRHGRVMGVVRIAQTLSDFERHLRLHVQMVFLVWLLAVLGCAVLGVLLARGIALSVQQMRDFAVGIGQGKLNQTLQVRRRDELGELAIELNRMAARLASLEGERRAFLANVSHELRTPVSNVHVTLEALENGAADDPGTRGRFIRTALEENARLSGLVRDLLDLGRLEAGVLALEKRPARLLDVVERCVRAMETRMLARGLRTEVRIADVELVIDVERITQALMNVLDNAVKFSSSGGLIRITGIASGSNAVLRIEDQGSGISAQDMPRIFEQFYTGDPARRRGGTGLGLAIARRVLESHGGSISAESEPGRGTTVNIRLPAGVAAMAA